MQNKESRATITIDGLSLSVAVNQIETVLPQLVRQLVRPTPAPSPYAFVCTAESSHETIATSTSSTPVPISVSPHVLSTTGAPSTPSTPILSWSPGSVQSLKRSRCVTLSSSSSLLNAHEKNNDDEEAIEKEQVWQEYKRNKKLKQDVETKVEAKVKAMEKAIKAGMSWDVEMQHTDVVFEEPRTIKNKNMVFTTVVTPRMVLGKHLVLGFRVVKQKGIVKEEAKEKEEGENEGEDEYSNDDGTVMQYYFPFSAILQMAGRYSSNITKERKSWASQFTNHFGNPWRTSKDIDEISGQGVVELFENRMGSSADPSCDWMRATFFNLPWTDA